MKTHSSTIYLAVASAVFAGLAAIVQAGPPSETWTPTKQISTFTDAKAVKPGAIVTMQCDKCKAVMIRDSKHVGPAGKGREDWFVVGYKHTCPECGGQITVVIGKITDSMGIDCSKCGKSAVRCCAAETGAP